MITKLITLFTCVGACLLNAPIEKKVVIDYHDTIDSQPFYNRNCQHSEPISSYVNVNYKYETNEPVKTSFNEFLDSMVSGNVYSFDLSCPYPDNSLWFAYLDFAKFKPLNSDVIEIVSTSNNNVIFGFSLNNGYYVQTRTLSDSTAQLFYLDSSIASFDFVYRSNVYFNPIYNYINSSSYNEIVSVEYIQPTTFLGYINEFLEEYLYRDLPLVQAMTFEIGGQQVNLMTWLILITGLGLCVLFIFIIINIIKWLIKIFTNGLLLK